MIRRNAFFVLMTAICIINIATASNSSIILLGVIALVANLATIAVREVSRLCVLDSIRRRVERRVHARRMVAIRDRK